MKSAAVSNHCCGLWASVRQLSIFKLSEWVWFHPLHSAGVTFALSCNLTITFTASAAIPSYNCRPLKSSERTRGKEATKENNWRRRRCVNGMKRGCVKVFIWLRAHVSRAAWNFLFCLHSGNSGPRLSARRTVWIVE